MRSVTSSGGPVLTVRQAAELYGISRSLVYEAIALGDLPRVEGTVKRVRLREFEAWVASHRADSTGGSLSPG